MSDAFRDEAGWPGAPIAPEPPRRRWWPWLLVALAAFLAGIGATVALLREVRPAGELVVPTAAARVVVRTLPPPPVAPDALAGRIAALERRLGTIDARAQAASGDADRAEGLLIAFAARRTVDRGAALGALEGLLRARFAAAEPQATAMILSGARRPVTLPQLQADLAALEPALGRPPPDEGWWTALNRELSALVVIRKADTPSPLAADRFARAERALALGQADLALTEIARLPNRARAAAWIDEARRYVLVRHALDRIETAALLYPPRPGEDH